MTRVVTTPEELRRVVGDQPRGFVPTMGALHEGHLTLIRRAAAENPVAVVSVFVNPTQFSDPTDLAAYPRDLAADAAAAGAAGAAVVYAPPTEVVYPPGFATSVEVARLTDRWEGAARPGHFRGVATVVTILLNSVRPARSYFGEKDYQQLVVVRRLARDLALPGEIVGCPTVRDADGLALSSRNARLSPPERARARVIPESLFHVLGLVEAGERQTARLVAAGRERLAAQPGLEVDYLAIVDGSTLDPLDTVVPGTRALVAVRLGGVRLIDNIELLPPSGPDGAATR